MKSIYNFISKYKKEILIILILIIISIGIYYFYTKNNYEGFFTTTPIITPTWNQLGQDIDGEAAGDESGYSVSLSSDGKIVAIGSRWNDDNGDKSGHVRVFKCNEDDINNRKWEQLGDAIPGEAADDQSGWSVSLSSDGTIVAIGAGSNDNGRGSGHVRVYEYDSINGWTQLGQDIDGEAAYDNSGYSVSLSSDGKIVAIGAIKNNDGGKWSGHVRIFKYDGTTWKQLGQDIPGKAMYDESGWSVSLSADGKIVAIGTPYSRSSGNVRIFKYDGTTWKQLGQDIDHAIPGDHTGRSVSLSSDGKIVAIGAPENDGINGADSGHVRIFKYDETTWKQLGNAIPGEAAGDRSGWSVSLSSDGKIVAIGARLNDGGGANSGHVRVFKYNEDDINNRKWEQLGNDIDGETAGDQSGYSVSLSSDGTIVAIGAPYNDDGGDKSGQVRIYKITPINCVGGFVNDGVCSEPCGPGRQDQIYEITIPAQFGGETCPNETGDTRVIDCNIQDCPTIDCIGVYEDVGKCVANDPNLNCGPGTQQQNYIISQPAKQGGVCPNENKTQSISCNLTTCPINCVGEYQNSGDCVANDPNLNCGPGTQQQEYRISQFAEHGGVCPNENKTRSISCNLDPCPIDCVGSFGEYGTCSKDCVGGTHSRTYTITKDAQHEGAQCLHPDGYVEEKDCNTNILCPIDCVGEFVPFKDCSRECGGGMFQEIYNITTEAQHGGRSCSNKQNDLKTSDCNMDPCPTYPINTTLQEALKESNNKIQNIRYNIIDRQEKLDTLTNKFNRLNKNISKIKTTSNYIPDDKTLTFY
jgi:hypothetical protein